MSSTFWFQLVWDLCACGDSVNFSHPVWVSVLQKQLKDTMYIPWAGNQDPGQGGTIVLICFSLPPLSLHHFPSLISNCLNLSVGTPGRSWRLNEAHFLLRQKGVHKKTFVPGSPIGSCWVSGPWLQRDKWCRKKTVLGPVWGWVMGKIDLITHSLWSVMTGTGWGGWWSLKESNV